MRRPSTTCAISHTGASGQFRIGSRVGVVGGPLEARHNVFALIALGHGDADVLVAHARISRGGGIGA